MEPKLKYKAGTVHPTEYDWKGQLSTLLEPSLDTMGFVSLDAGKVYGLAIYAEELELEIERLKQVDLIRGTVTGRISNTSPSMEEIPRELPDSPPPPTHHRGRPSSLGIPFKSGTPEYAREYYRLNKEKMNERTRDWQKRHMDKHKQSVIKYNQANPEVVKASQERYRAVVRQEKQELRKKSEESKPRFEEEFGGPKEGENDD